MQDYTSVDKLVRVGRWASYPSGTVSILSTSTNPIDYGCPAELTLLDDDVRKLIVLLQEALE